MFATSPFRILATDTNKVGDLFARLVEGVFLSLGYDGFRRNIHKSGREIDIEATHRKERRRLIGECKATEEAVGGAEINKFVGAVDAQRRKYPDPETVAYFVSLNGFTETAIEQEKEVGNSRVVLMNSKHVLEELVRGKIVCPTEIALHLAGKSLADSNQNLEVDPECELWAHDLGFIWAVYFTANHERTHLSLVHADGELLAATLAQEVIASDKAIGGTQYKLILLPPPVPGIVEKEEITLARTQYLEFVSRGNAAKSS
jgi:restriction endonuclease